MTSKLPITVLVMTYNEEINIEKCLKSVVDWVDELIIVDSYSTDKTLAITQNYTKNIYSHKYDGHPQQWQWALDNIKTKNDWIFAIDADFIVTRELWDELMIKLRKIDDIKGYYIRHRQIFKGRPILHGGVYPNYWLRIFNKKYVHVDQKELVDIHFYVNGKTEKIKYDILEHNIKDESIHFWIEKQNKFAKRQAIEEIQRMKFKKTENIESNLIGTPDQQKNYLKNIWFKLPHYFRPLVYFLYRYFFKFGFLDGKAGFIYHFTQGFFYRLLVDINIDELNITKK